MSRSALNCGCLQREKKPSVIGGGGAGTVNRIAKFDTATTIFNSSMTDDGVTVTCDVDLVVTGNLTVNGTQTIVNVSTMEIEDPLIELGKGNAADVVDLGFYANYNDGSGRFAGLFRDATDGKFKLFKNLTVEPTTTIATGDGSFQSADLVARTVESNVVTGTAPFTVASTTVVTNLNADLVDGRHESEFVLLAGRAGGQTWIGGTLTTQTAVIRGAVDDGTNSGLIRVGLNQIDIAGSGATDTSGRKLTVQSGVAGRGFMSFLYLAPTAVSGEGRIVLSEDGFPGSVSPSTIESVAAVNVAHRFQIHNGTTGTGAAALFGFTGDGNINYRGGNVGYYSSSHTAVAARAGKVVLESIGASAGILLYNDGANVVTMLNSGVNAAVAGLILDGNDGATNNVTGAVTDGFNASLRLTPEYRSAAAQTVDRHNYIDMLDAVLSTAALTDAAAMRFNAAIGAHKAVSAAFTTADSGAQTTSWAGGIKINVNGTLYKIPFVAA